VTTTEPSRRQDNLALPESFRRGNDLPLSDLIFQPAPAWQARAACRGCDPELFFMDRGQPTSEAKTVCRGCVVREECLEYAITEKEKFGIWGGLSERERRKIRVARKRAAS
jgi:WhiB family redox-sensing transcriptional regulator